MAELAAQTTLARLARVLVAVLAMQLLVLFATGTALFFAYRPGAGGAAGAFRLAHRVLADLTVLTAVPAAVVFGVTGRKWRGGTVPLGIGLAAAVALATLTGFLLPWDQLALWAVSVEGAFRGYTWLRDDRVRFALVGAQEFGVDTVTRWLALHVSMALVAAVLTAIATRATGHVKPRRPG